ncbi:MAG: substrate-binding domain-containing protein, partial [Demequinaceae bacterium]|nr:substrate-binding domain-containing protein [Demequinaceae bacterium]
MRKRFLTTIALAGAAALALSACSNSDSGTKETSASGGASGDTITVGFAQTGSESGWRSANTDSMKAAFSAANGFDLVFNAADNDPAAQITAVRAFINQGVDVIVMSPIVSDGWDDVLKEAKEAGIPVVLEDRTVSA